MMKLLNKYLDRNSKDLSYRNHRKLPLSPSSLLMITLWNTSVTKKLQRFLFFLLLLSNFFLLVLKGNLHRLLSLFPHKILWLNVGFLYMCLSFKSSFKKYSRLRYLDNTNINLFSLFSVL